MELRKIMTKVGVNKRAMFQLQNEVVNTDWLLYGKMFNGAGVFTYDYKNNLTEKGKVAAVIGLINDYIKFDGRKLVLTQKAFNNN